MDTLSHLLLVACSIVLTDDYTRSCREATCKSDKHVCDGAYCTYSREGVFSYKVSYAPSVEGVI